MSMVFSLAHLTVLDLLPPEVVRVAARTGYRTASCAPRSAAPFSERPGAPRAGSVSCAGSTPDDPAAFVAERDVLGGERVVVADGHELAVEPLRRPWAPGRPRDRIGRGLTETSA
jgi:hypothetical protein